MMINTHLIHFKEFREAFGVLTPIEEMKDIPFEIKRVYYITGVPKNVTRGLHSHRDLEQALICLNGSVKILIKTPFEEEIVQLDDPTVGLFIGNMIWREMFDFSDGAVLLTLASKYYTEDDYIRDYTVYEKEAKIYFGE